MSEDAESSFQVTVRLHNGAVMLFGVTGASQYKAAEKWLPRLISFHDQIARITVLEIEEPAARRIRQLNLRMRLPLAASGQ